MSFYLQIAVLSFNDHMRCTNVFSLTLELHDSNFNDVVDALQNLRHFDQDVVLELLQSTRICIFALCFLEDMSQQQANAEFKTQRANKDCCMCLIFADAHADLEFNIVRQDRFYTYAMQQRRKLEIIHIKTKKKEFASKWDLAVEKSSLFKISSVLDIILIWSSDSAHSKYADLCKLLHQLLIEIILTSLASKFYAIILCIWSFTSEFERIQFSLHYLKSYSLSEHARWIVIVSELLRCWLEKKHVQSLFLHAVVTHLRSNSSLFIATELIIKTFALVAKSTLLLMMNNLIERDFLIQHIKTARSHFQLLFNFAASVANENSRSHSVTSACIQKDSVESILSSTEYIESQMSQLQKSIARLLKKTQKFTNDQCRLNIHTALHYETTMKKFDMSSNVNVLIDEDKHRWVRNMSTVSVFQTFIVTYFHWSESSVS